ncbi:unnamed protein product [Prunus armeniaca]|uniref:Uncharacterized protein n=1 Tax=Prunus armeniaca TaxID=36596 RepID=A0A6J5W051_PRUAR|nr:unnamed protein product [Prunus armeniaca]
MIKTPSPCTYFSSSSFSFVKSARLQGLTKPRPSLAKGKKTRPSPDLIYTPKSQAKPSPESARLAQGLGPNRVQLSSELRVPSLTEGLAPNLHSQVKKTKRKLIRTPTPTLQQPMDPCLLAQPSLGKFHSSESLTEGYLPCRTARPRKFRRGLMKTHRPRLPPARSLAKHKEGLNESLTTETHPFTALTNTEVKFRRPGSKALSQATGGPALPFENSQVTCRTATAVETFAKSLKPPQATLVNPSPNSPSKSQAKGNLPNGRLCAQVFGSSQTHKTITSTQAKVAAA